MEDSAMLKVVFACCALIGAGILLAVSGGMKTERTVVTSATPVGVLQTQQSTASTHLNLAVPASRLPSGKNTPVQNSNLGSNLSPQKVSDFPAHEWVFITESDGLLFGDFIEPIELELEFEYGTAKIPLTDIVSFSRVQFEVDKKQNTFQPQFSAIQPTSSTYPYPAPANQIKENVDQELVKTVTEGSGEADSSTDPETNEPRPPS
jgi:hypothetical protein